MLVLVVDDRENFSWLIKKVLTSKGHHVLTAENGQTGLEMFRRHSPDFVITDMDMPVMDGLELVREIKKEKPAMKICMMSGSPSVQDKALGAGADFFIIKPFRVQQIEDLIVHAQHEHHMTERVEEHA